MANQIVSQLFQHGWRCQGENFRLRKTETTREGTGDIYGDVRLFAGGHLEGDLVNVSGMHQRCQRCLFFILYCGGMNHY